MTSPSQMPQSVPEIVVVGAGIAGASLAARLGEAGARVLMLEGEDRPGYHTTGRSAAFWHETLGGPAIIPLTRGSEAELRDGGFLGHRTGLEIARTGQEAALQGWVESNRALGVRIEQLDRTELAARVPGLREDWVAGALETDCADIDVAGLHQHYLARARAAGVELWTRARLAAAQREAGRWALTLEDGRSVTCGVLANADVTILCEQPKVGPHRDAMQARLAELLGVEPGRIGVKATTTERLGFTGRGEGIAAQAAVMLLLPA